MVVLLKTGRILLFFLLFAFLRFSFIKCIFISFTEISNALTARCRWCLAFCFHSELQRQWGDVHDSETNSINKLNNRVYSIFIKIPFFFFHSQVKPDNGHCLFREEMGINSQFEFKLVDNSSIKLEIVIPKTNTTKNSKCSIFNKLDRNLTSSSIEECIKFNPNKSILNKMAMSFATTPSPLRTRPHQQQLLPSSTLSSSQNHNIGRKHKKADKGRSIYKNSYNANEISFNSEKSVAPEDRSTSMPDSEFYSVATQQQHPHLHHHQLRLQQQQQPHPRMRHQNQHQRRKQVMKGQNRLNNSVGR